MNGLQNSINLMHVEYPMNIGLNTRPKDLLSATLQLLLQSYSNNKGRGKGQFYFHNKADGQTYLINADNHKLNNSMLQKLIQVKKLDNKIKANTMLTPNLTEAVNLSSCIYDYIKTFAGIVDLTKLEYLSKIRYNLARQYRELRV